jgi:sodium--glutamate symport carrier gltS
MLRIWLTFAWMVGAFFIDFTNAILIQLCLNLFA